MSQSDDITDNLGKLQYIPFATCNETTRPLSLHYGISESVTCTIPEVPDELYHLLEFYVHSDVPMTCRVPTAPLTPPSTPKSEEKDQAAESDSLASLSENGPPFTPLTVALQGTLQLSHLHMWTDMNMVMHNMASDAGAQPKKRKKNSQSGWPGYAVAGTAYSTPEYPGAGTKDGDEKEAAVALVKAAREPWTAGHGTKVVRGEPLTFSFHVAWVEGGTGIGWPARPASGSFLSLSNVGADQSSGSGFFSRVFFFLMAASLGALAALYWERNGGRWQGRSTWRGDGILGVPPSRGKGASGVTFGNGGRINGYGGYSAAVNGAGTTSGYGGFPSGKKD
ncbi:hypothetical protein N7492_005132 [Penicillium capsulatum]|uniref:Uncharacterized protein n=1 Tax=Penicillium capsulatum TaxID=69766 RepID=A0A9W9LQP3_9EURO|nr:hypothetical protein N7492_005132 [Penicillium capsulatum]